MSELRVDEPFLVGTTVADPATSTVVNFGHPRRNPVATGVVLVTGLIATFAWVTFLSWASFKIVGIW
jgi:hypothetical protein